MCAKASNANTRVYLDKYDISGYFNAAELSVKSEMAGVTAFSDVGPRRVAGNYDHSGRHNGFFDGVGGAVDEIVDALRGSGADHYLCQLFGANALGSIAYEQVVMMAEEPRSGQVGGAVLLNLSTEGSNGVSRGLVLSNRTATGTVNETGQNQGATTAGQVYQTVIRVISGTFTSITIKLQESQDDGGADLYADIAGLSVTLTAAGVSRLTTTSATEAWKRAVVSAFVGTNAVILVTGGVVAGT